MDSDDVSVWWWCWYMIFKSIFLVLPHHLHVKLSTKCFLNFVPMWSGVLFIYRHLYMVVISRLIGYDKACLTSSSSGLRLCMVIVCVTATSPESCSSSFVSSLSWNMKQKTVTSWHQYIYTEHWQSFYFIGVLNVFISICASILINEILHQRHDSQSSYQKIRLFPAQYSLIVQNRGLKHHSFLASLWLHPYIDGTHNSCRVFIISWIHCGLLGISYEILLPRAKTLLGKWDIVIVLAVYLGYKLLRKLHMQMSDR